jgi:hypothetical protein
MIESKSKSGFLSAIGQLALLVLVIAVLYAMATHESRLVRLMFWSLAVVFVYYGWIEPALNPEPEMYTTEWYVWRLERYK